MTEAALRHGSCVALDGRGVLILGRSGSGKSSLVLKLMALGCDLVADDQVRLQPRDGAIIATAPERLSGLVEARGIGLMRMHAVDSARLLLAVDLDREAAARLPQPELFCITDACIPLIAGQNRPILPYVLMAGLRSGDTPLFLQPDGSADDR